MTTLDNSFYSYTPAPLVEMSDEALESEFAGVLTMLRLAVDRYDLVDARYYSRQLDRIEAEQRRRVLVAQ